jgi:hypothetical protein
MMKSLKSFLGYSERGLVAAWFSDLAQAEDAHLVLAELLDGPSETYKKWPYEWESADRLLFILEPGFSGFGDPDGVIVALGRDDQPQAVLYIEAKRHPLLAEWNDSINAVAKDRTRGWNSSHLVVQVARRLAFTSALGKNGRQVGKPVVFGPTRDYWKVESKQRVMKLSKELNIRWADQWLRGAHVCVATLTSTARHGKDPTLLDAGNDALEAILGSWGLLPNPHPLVHLGLDDLLEARMPFPTLEETFLFNAWDTVTPVLTWKNWRNLAEKTFGAAPFAELDSWLVQNNLKKVTGRPGQAYRLHKYKGKAAVRLVGSAGPSGPILEIQVYPKTRHAFAGNTPLDQHIPPGWEDWSARRGIGKWFAANGMDAAPPNAASLKRILLVPG